MTKQVGQDAQVRCTFCNKVLTRVGTTETGHGARCAQVQKVLSGKSIHSLKLVDPRIKDNKNYIKVADLHRMIDARKAVVGGLSVNKMVQALGGDRVVNAKGAKNASTSVVITPIYAGIKGTRFVHRWCSTITGMRAIANGDFSKVSKAASVQAKQAVLQAQEVKS